MPSFSTPLDTTEKKKYSEVVQSQRDFVVETNKAVISFLSVSEPSHIRYDNQ